MAQRTALIFALVAHLFPDSIWGWLGSRSVLTRSVANPDTVMQVAQGSELATELTSYAKTKIGSVFSVDRRGDGPARAVPRNQRVANVGDTQ